MGVPYQNLQYEQDPEYYLTKSARMSIQRKNFQIELEASFYAHRYSSTCSQSCWHGVTPLQESRNIAWTLALLRYDSFHQFKQRSVPGRTNKNMLPDTVALISFKTLDHDGVYAALASDEENNLRSYSLQNPMIRFQFVNACPKYMIMQCFKYFGHTRKQNLKFDIEWNMKISTGHESKLPELLSLQPWHVLIHQIDHLLLCIAYSGALKMVSIKLKCLDM